MFQFQDELPLDHKTLYHSTSRSRPNTRYELFKFLFIKVLFLLKVLVFLLIIVISCFLGYDLNQTHRKIKVLTFRTQLERTDDKQKKIRVTLGLISFFIGAFYHLTQKLRQDNISAAIKNNQGLDKQTKKVDQVENGEDNNKDIDSKNAADSLASDKNVLEQKQKDWAVLKTVLKEYLFLAESVLALALFMWLVLILAYLSAVVSTNNRRKRSNLEITQLKKRYSIERVRGILNLA